MVCDEITLIFFLFTKILHPSDRSETSRQALAGLGAKKQSYPRAESSGRKKS